MFGISATTAIAAGGLALTAYSTLSKGGSASSAQEDATVSKMEAIGNAHLMQTGAQSSFEQATTKGGIDGINAQVKYDYAVNQSVMTKIGMDMQVEDMKNQAAISAIGTQAHIAGIGAQIIGLEFAAAGDRLRAKTEEMGAQSALLAGQNQEASSDEKYAEAKSHQTTVTAASNVALGEGSALAVASSIDLKSQQASIAIQQQAALQAFGHRSSEIGYEMDAAGKDAQASALGGEASLLSEQSTLNTALVGSKATAMEAIAQGNENLGQALASAGLSNDKATIGYALGMAHIDFENASSAADTKLTIAQSIDPHAAGSTAILNGLTSMVNQGFSLYRSGAFGSSNPNPQTVNNGYDINTTPMTPIDNLTSDNYLNLMPDINFGPSGP